jgi:hypothetical protein
MSYGHPESAPKPDNFEAMAKAWTDPMQWAVEVALYNAQLVDTGEQLTPVTPHLSYAHSKHLTEHTRRGHLGPVG